MFRLLSFCVLILCVVAIPFSQESKKKNSFPQDSLDDTWEEGFKNYGTNKRSGMKNINSSHSSQNNLNAKRSSAFSITMVPQEINLEDNTPINVVLSTVTDFISVRFTVLDHTNHIIYRTDTNKPTNVIIWNLTDDYKNKIAPGNYSIEITAIDKKGNVSVVRSPLDLYVH